VFPEYASADGRTRAAGRAGGIPDYLTLHEERPVIEKETVPVERVRLDKETVTDEVTVDEEVRKERIDTDGIDDARR
jgi:stress response protein YsnF